MRAELEITEQIENYLLNNLDLDAMKKFTSEIETDPDLKDLVDSQDLMMKAFNRIELKEAIHRGLKSYLLKKFFIKVAMVFGFAAIITIAFFVVKGKDETNTAPIASSTEITKELEVKTEVRSASKKEETTPTNSNSITKDEEDQSKNKNSSFLNEESEDTLVPSTTILGKQNASELLKIIDGGAYYERHIETQVFTIDNKENTIIETKSGIFFFIPKGAVSTSGEYKILVKDAIEDVDIILGGYNTKTVGGEVLETEGMFRIEAFRGGTPLNLIKEIVVKVPSDKTLNPNMKLWKGKRNSDGLLEWENETTLENYLIPVDILTLDFYPPNYENECNKRGLPATKKYRDSLYYSYSGYCGTVSVGISYSPKEEKIPNTANKISKRKQTNQLIKEIKNDQEGPCNIIDPERIKAIWRSEFNNCNLATIEFEKRLKDIHQFCDKRVFDLYVNNLDKNLFELDSMAIILYKTSASLSKEKMQLAISTFKKHQDLRETKVKIDEERYKNLSEYIDRKNKELENKYEAAVLKLKEKINRDKLNAKETRSLIRKSSIMRNKRPQPYYYGFTVKSFGNYNIDCIRSEMQEIAKNDKIPFVNVFVEKQAGQKVLMMPHRFKAYLNLKENISGYRIKIGSNPQYDLVAYNFIDSSNIYYAMKRNLTGYRSSLKLKKGSIEGLRRMLVSTKLDKEAQNLQSRLETEKQMEIDKINFKKAKAEEQFREELAKVIFKGCYFGSFKPWLPNAFTPNRDGLNDSFQASNIDELYGTFTLTIFNSKNEQVFQTSDPDYPWSGTYGKGQRRPAGKYSWVFKYSHNGAKEVVEKGSIHLLRD